MWHYYMALLYYIFLRTEYLPINNVPNDAYTVFLLSFSNEKHSVPSIVHIIYCCVSAIILC